MKQLHKIQRDILYKLLFSPGLRYSEVKPNKRIENNQFDFHLDQLIKLGYIEHIESIYKLTNSGKDFTNRIDRDEKIHIYQAKLGVVVVPFRIKNGNEQFLIYTRLKQPFYGCQGFMSGKIKYGEKVLHAAEREFAEETHLKGKPYLVGIRHYHVFNVVTKELVEDKFLFFCGVENPTGNLKPNNEGTFTWVEKKDFKKFVTNHFESFERFLQDVKLITHFSGDVKLVEVDQFTDKY